MPKCEKCGRRFQTLAALQDHYKAVHPNQRFIAPKASGARNLMVGLVIVIIVVGAVVGYLIYVQTTQKTTTTTQTQTGILGQAISTEIYNNLTSVSSSTLSAVGSGNVNNPPKPVTGSSLTLGGRPEILYIGGEFCPYCAAERWSLVVALSKFGYFNGLEYMQSAENDGNLATFTFVNTNYTSDYIAFVTVEQLDRNHQPLQTPTQQESSLMSQYDSSSSIPFVDYANQYVLVGAEYPDTDLSNLNWTQIASQLNNPNSKIAKDIDGAANTIITIVCKIDGGQPSSVCHQSYANLTLSISPPSPTILGEANSPLFIRDVIRGSSPSEKGLQS